MTPSHSGMFRVEVSEQMSCNRIELFDTDFVCGGKWTIKQVILSHYHSASIQKRYQKERTTVYLLTEREGFTQSQ